LEAAIRENLRNLGYDSDQSLVPLERIEAAILLIRERRSFGCRLGGALWGGNQVLIQAVKRNVERFPPDFMFQLTKEKWTS